VGLSAARFFREAEEMDIDDDILLNRRLVIESLLSFLSSFFSSKLSELATD
jgi:hypothetical protein